jgi:hypothetical protein
MNLWPIPTKRTRNNFSSLWKAASVSGAVFPARVESDAGIYGGAS